MNTVAHSVLFLKITLPIVFILLFSQHAAAQQGWYILSQSQSSNNSISDMKFTSGETGFATTQYGNGHVGFGSVTKTTNGGLNWFMLEQGVPKYGVFFLNENTGWVTGGFWDDANNRSREVFKTTNAGINFTRIYIGSFHNFLSKIFFTDQNTGWMISSTDLLKTTDSGINWTVCLTQQLYSVCFINNNTGWAAGSAGLVCKTTNGGLNWTSQTIGQNTLREIFFINVNTGWVCGGSANIYKSTNSGSNWTGYNSGQYNVNAIEFFDQYKGWASGDSGKMVYTTNGGINWIPQVTGVNHGLGLLCFPNANTGYARGSKLVTIYPYTVEVVFLKTTTGGITFVKNTNSKIPLNFSLSQNYPNPFNPVTKIKFSIPPSRGARGVTNLTIYDVLGREIATLVNEQLNPGTYEVEWSATGGGTNYPSGVYFYKLSVSGAEPLITSEFTETKKMVLIK